MKPARVGGLHEARKMADLLGNAGLLMFGSGLTEPDISLAASLVLYGGYDLATPAALNGPQFLRGSILRKPFEVVDGHLAVPAGPGLGVEVDEEKMRALLVKDVP